MLNFSHVRQKLGIGHNDFSGPSGIELIGAHLPFPFHNYIFLHKKKVVVVVLVHKLVGENPKFDNDNDIIWQNLSVELNLKHLNVQVT